MIDFSCYDFMRKIAKKGAKPLDKSILSRYNNFRGVARDYYDY